MTFLNEFIRHDFHKLPLDEQRFLIEFDCVLQKIGKEIEVFLAGNVIEGESELAIRIFRKGDDAA